MLNCCLATAFEMLIFILVATVLVRTMGFPTRLTDIASRSTGGMEATPGQFPYMASIQSESSVHNCAGTILSPEYILTASRCFKSQNNVMVVVGEMDYRVANASRYFTKEKWLHDEVSSMLHGEAVQITRNDIAIVKLSKPIDEGLFKSGRVSAVSLAKKPLSEGTEVLSVGWRKEQSTETTSTHLIYIEAKILHDDVCRKDFPILQSINTKLVCAAERNGSGICSDDYGSPLIDKQSGQQVGILSDCATGTGLFLPVLDYLDWISEHTGLSL